MDDKPTDLIPQAQAAALIGRTVDTIRRWRRDGRLRVFRDAHPTAVAMVSRAEVLALAGQVSPPAKVGSASPGRLVQPVGIGPADTILAVQAHLATLQGMVDDLSRQRDSLQAEASRLREQLRELEQLHSDARRRVEALERELASPVKALLGAGRRWFGG